MTPRRTVWERQTDGLQYATGCLIGLAVSLAVIWGTGGLLLVWAFS